MVRYLKALGLAMGLLFGASVSAEQSGRPDDLRIADFQFGPNSRWAFSHVREVLPTVNIAHDRHRILELERSQHASDDFALEFQGKNQRLDEIADHQYIDGILVLKDGKIAVEKYYGHLMADRPHLMMSVTKSVVGLLAGKLAADGVIDLSKSVADYVPAARVERLGT